MRRSGHGQFAELGFAKRKVEGLVEHPPAFVQPALQEPRIEARLFDTVRHASPTLEMYIYERPLGGVARHVRVQVTHVCEVCVDDLIRRRLTAR